LLQTNRALLLAGVLAQTPVASVLFWNIPERFPVALALGRESHESFLARSLPESNGARVLNPITKPEEKILGVGVENARFYFDIPLYTQHYIDPEATGLKNPTDLRNALVRDGFAYIVAANAQLNDPPSILPYLQPAFLEPFGEEVYRDETSTVFRIRHP
jgi:hypothetical protein